MSKVTERIDAIMNNWISSDVGENLQVAIGIATAEQLERIADALEKQNAGGRLINVDNSSVSVDKFAEKLEEASQNAYKNLV